MTRSKRDVLNDTGLAINDPMVIEETARAFRRAIDRRRRRLAAETAEEAQP